MRRHHDSCPRASGHPDAPCWCWKVQLKMAWWVVQLLVIAYFVARVNCPKLVP